MPVNAILNVNKPAGWTSFDVVRFVRGRSGERHTGHAGTLDPAATGVLPVLLGSATRLTEYLMDATKQYDAVVELGVTTDTYDLEGEALRREDPSAVTLTQIEAALSQFRGVIEQVPPLYSALKREGVALYKLARRGEAVELRPRQVRVDELDIIDYAPPLLQLRIVCGKGFYVRSLAHDLGTALGVGGALRSLERRRVGSFRIEDAADIESLREEFETGEWRERLYAPDEILLGWRAAIVGPENETRLRHGQRALIAGREGLDFKEGDLCRAYTASGDFLAVLRAESEKHWQPHKVFLG